MYIPPISFSGKVIEFPASKQIGNNSYNNAKTGVSADVFVKSQASESPNPLVESLDDQSRKLRELVRSYREKTASPEIIADKMVTILKDSKTKNSLERELDMFDSLDKDEIDIEPIERFYDMLAFLSENLQTDLPNGNKKTFTMLSFEPYDEYYKTYAKKYYEVFGDDEEFDVDAKSMTGRPLILNSVIDLEAGKLSKNNAKIVYNQVKDGLKDAFILTDKPELQIAVEIGDDFDVKTYTHAFKTFMQLVSDAKKEAKSNKK